MKTMNDFYTFDSRAYLATFAARAAIFREAIVCKEFDRAGEIMDDLIKGRYEKYQFPLVFDAHEGTGKNFRDVLNTRHPPAYLISDRMKSLLEEHGITGWKSYPIELYDRKKRQIFGYNGFSITGRAGKMDPRKQPVVINSFGQKRYKGGYFDIDTWDGSDFFLLQDSYWLIVTGRVVALLTKNKVTALEYHRLSEEELDYEFYK